MKKILNVLLFIAATTSIFSQNSLSGVVTNSETGEPIIGATIYFPQLAKGTSSNLDGFFKIENLPNGSHNLVVSGIGFSTFSRTIKLPAENELEISLRPTAIEMEEVIISTPFHKLQSENVMKISRATINELQNKGAISLVEGISQIPGVSNISTGSGIGKPVIRGLSSNRVLVYSQGIRVENQQFGDEHGLGVNAAGVESVEVIKGPASLLYGSDALGGVIYLNPEKYAMPDSTDISAQLKYSSNTLGTDANIGFKHSGEEFKYLVRGAFSNHSDYKTGNGLRVTNSRFKEYDLKTGVGFQNQKIKSDLRYNYSESHIGIPEEIGAQTTSKEMHEPYQEITNHIISLDNRIYFSQSSLDFKIGYFHNGRKEFEEHHEHDGHENEEEHDEAALNMQLKTLSYDLKYNLPNIANFETIFGVQGMLQENSNYGHEILIPDARIFDIGFFTTTHFHFEKLDLQAGLRYDNRYLQSESHHTPEEPEYLAALQRNFNSFNAAFGAKYDLTENLVSRLNFSSGFRAPNLAELTSKGSHHGANRYELGNPNLENEQSFQIDLALEYGNRHFEIFANGFYNHINKYIFLDPTGDFFDDDPIFEYTQENAKLYGGEAGIHLHPHPLDWLHLESSFETVTGIRENNDFLPLIPASSFSNTLQIEFDQVLFFQEFISFFNVESVLTKDNVDISETETNGYSLFNIGFNGKVYLGKNIFHLGVSANNLFNKNYISHLSRLKTDEIANRGRNISISLGLEI